ncbi:hypothetical protein EDD17DRAFT_921784 [Pisolithus thermaeus]|nr:hypothetical protein EDD17DRAFT_921784 [Pisolithus thermaeus]
MHYSGDASIIKFLVGAVWILDTLHVAFSEYLILESEWMTNRSISVSYITLLPGEADMSTPCDRRARSLQITNYGVPTSLEYDVWSSSLFFSKLLPADDIWQVVPPITFGEFICGYRSSVLLRTSNILSVSCRVSQPARCGGGLVTYSVA